MPWSQIVLHPDIDEGKLRRSTARLPKFCSSYPSATSLRRNALDCVIMMTTMKAIPKSCVAHYRSILPSWERSEASLISNSLPSCRSSRDLPNTTPVCICSNSRSKQIKPSPLPKTAARNTLLGEMEPKPRHYCALESLLTHNSDNCSVS